MTLQKNILQDRVIAISGKSPVFGRIARCLIEQEHRMLFMTAEQAAKEAGVSQGSVSRFCSELGFAGYSDFIRYLQEQSNLQTDQTAPERLRFTENLDETTVKIISSERENLDQLYKMIQTQEYKKMVETIQKAERILLISARISATLLDYLSYILNKIRDQVEIVPVDSGKWNTMALNDPEGTLILTVAFPRYPDVLIRKLQELKAHGFCIMSFTDSLLSPVVPLSENSVVVPLTKNSVFDVYSTPILLFNILLKDVASGIPGLEDRMKRMEQMDEKNQVYYQPGKR